MVARNPLLTIALIFLFTGGMFAIAGSSFITSGGVSEATWLKVAYIELGGLVFGVIGAVLLLRKP